MEDLLKILKWSKAQDKVKVDLEWAAFSYQKLDSELKLAEANLARVQAEIQHAQELVVLNLKAEKRQILQLLEQKSWQYNEAYSVWEEQKKLEKFAELEYADACKTSSELMMRRRICERNLYTAQNQLEAFLKIQKSLNTGVCPTCHRPLENVVVTIEGNEDQIRGELATATKAFNEADIAYTEASKHVNVLSVRKSEATAYYKGIALDKIRQEMDSLHENVKTISARIEEAGNALNADYTEEIDEYEWIISSRKETLRELQQGMIAMEYWKGAFSYKGIPSMQIAESLPMLVQQINEYLPVLSDNDLLIDILPVDANRKGKLLDQLTFLVWKKGRWMYLEDTSDGEQRRIVISMFLALSSIQSLFTGVEWNVRFIDELFDGLDRPGIECVMKVLHGLSTPTIIVTSHRSELREFGFSKMWIAKSGLGGSRLITV